MLDQEQEYATQKNKEHIWQQAKRERQAFREKYKEKIAYLSECWDETDEFYASIRYEELCKMAGITPW